METEGGNLDGNSRGLIVGMALLQGILLFGLHATAALQDWPPVLSYAAYSLVILLPLLTNVSVSTNSARGLYWALAGYGLLVTLLGAYRGQQCSPADTVRCEPFAYVLSLVVATFVVAFFLRACTSGGRQLHKPEYPALFHFSWDNALSAALAGAFAAIFALILVLWAGIFSLVGIDLFATLFRQPWFYYPVGSLALAVGLLLFRSQQSFVRTLKRLLRTLLVALLPLLAALTLLFIATLPFTGLQPVWDTNRGSALMLWLVALLLFFTNGVVQDDVAFAHYPRFLNRLLLAALLVAPIYCVIALYGLSLRVEQYGWTPQRLWGITVAITLTLVAAGYCAAILRRGGHWAAQLRWINTALALWVLAVCLLSQSPLLDFWKISARDQLARLQSGSESMRTANLTFLRRELGRPGLMALRELRDSPAADAQLAARIDRLIDENSPLPSAEQQRLALYRLPVLPAGAALPGGLDPLQLGLRNQCTEPHPQCFWLLRDLDGDQRAELLLFNLDNDKLRVFASAELEGHWQPIGHSAQRLPIAFDELRNRVASGEYRLQPARWQSLQLGEQTLFDPTQ